MSAGQPPTAANPYAPPQSALDPAALPPLEAGGFKSARGLANALAIVLGVLALVELVTIAHGFVTIGVMRRVVAGEDVEKGVLTSLDVRAGALGVLSTLLYLATIVLFCVFMPWVNRNARWFRAPLENSPGWAAGWFFVPIASWWKPYQAMKEIWQGSDPDPAVLALDAPVSALLPWWWAMFVLKTIGEMIMNQTKAHGAAELISASRLRIVCHVPSIAAAILAAAVVRALARRQDERQRRERAAVKAGAAPVTAGAAP
jgi:hypothetical protein